MPAIGNGLYDFNVHWSNGRLAPYSSLRAGTNPRNYTLGQGLARDWNLEYPRVSSTGGNGFFGDLFKDTKITDWMSGLAGLGQAGMGLWNAYNGMKQLDIARQQFGFEKALANRNIANQAKIINNTYDNAAQVAAGMIGGVDANGNFGFVDPNLVDRYAQKAKERHVDGSPIG